MNKEKTYLVEGTGLRGRWNTTSLSIQSGSIKEISKHFRPEVKLRFFELKEVFAISGDEEE